MTTLTEAIASPMEVAVGGETYKMAPMNAEVVGNLVQWARGEYLKRSREQLGREYTDVLPSLMAHISSWAIHTPDVQKLLFKTDAGVRRVYYELIRQVEDDFRLGMLDDATEDELEQLAQTFMMLHHGPATDDEDGEDNDRGNSRKPVKRQRKKSKT